MKRTIITALAVALLAGVLSPSIGCSTTSGRYFQRTRENKPHVFRNRIYNPADYRYASADRKQPGFPTR